MQSTSSGGSADGRAKSWKKRNSTRDSLSRLSSARLDAVREGFLEEMHESLPSRRRRVDSAERLTDSEDEKPTMKQPRFATADPMPAAGGMNFGEAMLKKMGYVEGSGLGKSGQGRTEPIPMSTQRGRMGLGHEANLAIGRNLDAKWDSSEELKTVEETVRWMSVSDEIREHVLQSLCDDWMVVGNYKGTLDDEDTYCDGELLSALLSSKSVFDTLEDRELRDARTRANPYETIGGVFFQNRAAMKVANLDRVFDWSITKKDPGFVDEKRRKNDDRELPVFYFADVCAGPGGFTEYVLWRRGFYNAKGFGFTLRDKNDFKLNRFTAASPEYFEPCYGETGDGDVTVPENIVYFERMVKKGTNNVGVDLMMADGGFSVEGQENIQEILSKRIYLCQFLVALSVLRTSSDAEKGGVFFCKLFDIFTPFSVGLIYLMYIVFKRISLHKPHTSRPANSERYIVCEELNPEGAKLVKEYMTTINNRMHVLQKENGKKDVVEVVPARVMAADQVFMEYIVEHNERLVRRQTQYLNKYRVFAQNAGQIDLDQGKLRDECLRYWRIPDLPKLKPADMNEAVYAALARLCNPLPEFKELHKVPPPFDVNVLASDNENRIRCDELRMCALTTDKRLPMLLVGTRSGIFCLHNDDHSPFQKLLEVSPRIPRDSVFLVEKTTAYELDEKNVLTQGRPVIRIVDAAVINGDDVTRLSYEQRVAAARKMCDVVNLVDPVPDRNCTTSTVLVLAPDVFKMDELRHEMSRFRVIREKRMEVAVIQEGGRFFRCTGMRVVSLFAEKWALCWSKSRKALYAYDKTRQQQPVYEEQFTQSGCWADFWKTAASRKSKTPNRPVEDLQWRWNWTYNCMDDNEYGPKPILEADEHPTGLTLRSVVRIASEQKEKCR